MTTNITQMDKDLFDALCEGGNGFALFSCFFEGRPTTAIVLVKRMPGGDIEIAPAFVRVDDEMAKKLRDHDDTPAFPIDGPSEYRVPRKPS